MTIEQLALLSDGLTVSLCGDARVLDRMRVVQEAEGVDLSFRIAGTDLVPRLHLSQRRLASSSWEEMATLLRHVAVHAAGCSQAVPRQH